MEKHTPEGILRTCLTLKIGRAVSSLRIDDFRVGLAGGACLPEAKKVVNGNADGMEGTGDEDIIPLVHDDFESYLPGEDPAKGGWMVSSAVGDGLRMSASDSSRAMNSPAFLTLDSRAPISGLRSGKGVIPAGATLTLSKPVSWPERVPFAVSAKPFAIVPPSRPVDGRATEITLPRDLDDRPIGDDDDRDLHGPHAAAPATVPPVRATLYGTTFYIHSFDGKLLAEYDGSGACVRDYIYFGNRLIAEYQPATGKTYYYTPDQINSTRMITDSTGTVVYSAVFDPYGGMQKEWVNTYTPSLKFSGKEREAQSELDYFGARYYDHLNYRFLSVDPVINKDEALANPQLWNLYAYCRNNPVTFFDPDGRDSILGIFSNVQPRLLNFNEGHAWISVLNLEKSEKSTYGLWPDNHRYAQDNGSETDVRMNIEKAHPSEYPETTQYRRYYYLDSEREVHLKVFLNSSKNWHYKYNCADWAAELIQYVVGEFIDAKDRSTGVGIFGTPRKLSKSIAELNSVINRSDNPRTSDLTLKENQ